ncbi:nucleotidyltransferase family protein [Mangrovivirga sp. M17]|uniref:Nucleotidyltransferase family protein n=1 Tax=Mangrovivirga halotolerans TaxID=2993936 RepID=A0ABT3RQE3_9BACT|nr:nucleotidyltransferase family protein [Mangrovivirga halotolerans]MCX2743851.1 nucleotidyltransferase family protein [Mangrovivirga halotolerans]
MKQDNIIGVIILAAGSSSRLGFPKQLVQFHGKPLLQHVIDVTDSIPLRVKVLVLGAETDEIKKQINTTDFKVVINENWNEGIASSIRSGLKAAQDVDPELEHVVILLSDQPFIERNNLINLIEVQLKGQNHATYSEYENEIGVPAIFSKDVFKDLEKLSGDQGAKKLIHRDNFEFKTVKFDKGIFDVDTQVDVDRLKQYE